MEAALWELTEGDASDEVEVIVRLHQPHLPPPHIRIISQFGSIVTCRLRRSAILDVRRHERVASMKAPMVVMPDLDPVLGESEYEPTHASDNRRPLAEHLTGRGVVVGVIDWGCDFTHPNFRHPNGRTRLLALWDQTAPYLDTRPNRYGYGAVHARLDIERALQAERPDVALGYLWQRSDPDDSGGHGTHVMDIAAGNGRVGPCGVAPEADLVFVHLASRALPGQASLGDSVSLLEALDFILRKAGDRPVCINTSMGRQAGAHDGSSLVEQAFDAALTLAPCRFIGQSTGNYYDRDAHSSGQLRPGQVLTIPFVVGEADVTPNELEVWYPGRDVIIAQVRAPTGAVSRETGLDDEASLRIGDRDACRVYQRAREPNNLDNAIHVYMYAGAPAGRWELILRGEDIVDGRFNAWIERDAGCFDCQARFDAARAVRLSTTGSIANGFRPVAVGAYDAHDPDRRLGAFSSSGPTRDGRIKPDLLAPGVRVLAARSTPRVRGDRPLYLTRKSGTSMAAPHVTGAVALMYEAAGRPLHIQEVRSLLMTSARRADVTGDAIHRVGSGYLDIDAAIASVRSDAGGGPLRGQPERRPAADQEGVAMGDAQLITTSADSTGTGEDWAEDADGATLGYGVRGGRITDPFYRDLVEKQSLTGRATGRRIHLGIDVSTSNASGGGADDARRGLPVYAAIRGSIPFGELAEARAVDGAGGSRAGVGGIGTGTAVLDHALVLAQPWSSRDAGAYGGVLGLACRYTYSKPDGSSGTLTMYVEFLHLITPTFLPKDGSSNLITAEAWDATGKGIGFGPQMRNGARLSAAELTGGTPLLVGYLGATPFPHVHIQVSCRDGAHGYLRTPRIDPTVMLHAALATTAAEASEGGGAELADDLEESFGPLASAGSAYLHQDRSEHVQEHAPEHRQEHADVHAHAEAAWSSAPADEERADDESEMYGDGFENESRPFDEGEAPDVGYAAGESAHVHDLVEIAEFELDSGGVGLTPRDHFERVFASADPGSLFQAFRYDGSQRQPAATGGFELVLGAGARLVGMLAPGDVILRRMPEDGYLHVAFVASADVLDAARARASGWRLEGDRPGFYVRVVEAGAAPHRRDSQFARRLLDAQGRGSRQQVVVRTRSPGESGEDDPPVIGGMQLTLGGVNFVMNWLNDREQQRRVQEALRRVEPEIGAERQRHPDRGVIVLVRYHQVMAPPDSLIRPGAVFSPPVSWASGRSRDEARRALASRPTLRSAVPRGSQEHASWLWMPPLQPSAGLHLQTPFPRVAYGTFARGSERLQGVTWGGVTGFNDRSLTRLDVPSASRARFLVLNPPATIEYLRNGRRATKSIPLVGRRTAAGGPQVTAVDLDPLYPFDDVAAVPIFPYDDLTDRIFQLARQTYDTLGQLRTYVNIGKMRWARPEHIALVPDFSTGRP